MPADPLEKWLVDMPDGDPARTAIGEWCDASGEGKGEIFVVRGFDNTDLHKTRLKSVNDREYVMEYAAINEYAFKTIVIPKQSEFDFTYFAFANGGQIVYPAPPKQEWDLLFTRYRHVYEDLENFPYVVSGVLLNPYSTTAYEDSTGVYDAMDMNNIPYNAFTKKRDVIGFDWKVVLFDPNTSKAEYKIDARKFYVVKTSKGEYWKMKFHDFYDKDGNKGSPAFEYIRVK